MFATKEKFSITIFVIDFFAYSKNIFSFTDSPHFLLTWRTAVWTWWRTATTAATAWWRTSTARTAATWFSLFWLSFYRCSFLRRGFCFLLFFRATSAGATWTRISLFFGTLFLLIFIWAATRATWFIPFRFRFLRFAVSFSWCCLLSCVLGWFFILAVRWAAAARTWRRWRFCQHVYLRFCSLLFRFSWTSGSVVWVIFLHLSKSKFLKSF